MTNCRTLDPARLENDMPAVQETIDQVRQIDVDQYKYGFETNIEVEKAESVTVTFADGEVAVFGLEDLRRACPCERRADSRSGLVGR